MAGSKTPTIHDVARVAGVSHMTVSRVLNGSDAVRPDTRALVEDAIVRLQYAPNQMARALSRAKQARVALLHRFPNPGSLGEFLIHLLQAATRAHTTLIIREIAREEEDAEAVAELVEQRVRGVILSPPLGDDATLVERLRATGMMVVATGAITGATGLPSVGIDERSAASAMTAHLLALGHRRIGFVTGRGNHASAPLRFQGYRIALEAAGLAPDPALVADGLYTYQSGLDAAERLLSLQARPTAIFASNDDMAAAAIAVAHRHGIDVPSQLSICGFDDSPLATTIWPPLTTIRQPTVELTQTALEMVLRGLSQRDRAPASSTPEQVQLDHLLVRRASVAPARTP